MNLTRDTKWEVERICRDYAHYRLDGGIKTFTNWYFPNEGTDVIKKIYFKDTFKDVITILEFDKLTEMYTDECLLSGNVVWFTGWFDDIEPLIIRGEKIKKIRSGYNK